MKVSSGGIHEIRVFGQSSGFCDIGRATDPSVAGADDGSDQVMGQSDRSSDCPAKRVVEKIQTRTFVDLRSEYQLGLHVTAVPSALDAQLELKGQDADAAIPGLRAHLAGCPACREEHESLRALVSGQL